MGTATILPPREPKNKPCSRELREDVFTCLKRQPNVPVPFEVIVECIAGSTPEQVEQAIDTLEGPVIGIDGSDSGYVHRARCSRKAVFIS